MHWHVPIEPFDYFIRRPMPVLDKRDLHTKCRRTINAKMGISPSTNVGIKTQILFTDIQPSDPGFIAIDDNDLAMIPKINLSSVT